MPAILLNILKFILKILKWGFIAVAVLFAIIVLYIAIIMYRHYNGYGYDMSGFLRKEWRQNNYADSFYVSLANMDCEWDTLYHYRAYPHNDTGDDDAYFDTLHKGCSLVYKLNGKSVAEEEFYCLCCEMPGTVMFSPYAKDWKVDRNSANYMVHKTYELFYLKRVEPTIAE